MRLIASVTTAVMAVAILNLNHIINGWDLLLFIGMFAICYYEFKERRIG